jgi:uncharacterized YigZ family protein
MKYYYSIEKRASEKIIVKKSVFIAEAFPIGSAEDAEGFVAAKKKEFYDAAHNCYAYILGENEMRFSDDGEPQGTAGLPILSVLKKRNLNKILVVVTRYFGGIKLGAAGLVSAYSDACAGCLNGAEIKKYVLSDALNLSFDYSFIKAVDGVLSGFGENAGIISAEYSENVRYKIFIEEGLTLSLKDALKEKTNGAISIDDGEKGYRAISE